MMKKKMLPIGDELENEQEDNEDYEDDTFYQEQNEEYGYDEDEYDINYDKDYSE